MPAENRSEEKLSHTLIDSITSCCFRKGQNYLVFLQPIGTANTYPLYHVSLKVRRHPLIAHGSLLRSLLAAATENFMW